MKVMAENRDDRNSLMKISDNLVKYQLKCISVKLMSLTDNDVSDGRRKGCWDTHVLEKY